MSKSKDSNDSDIDEMISVLQAYKEGKKIQQRGVGGWTNDPEPIWDFNTYDYRVDPNDTRREWTPGRIASYVTTPDYAERLSADFNEDLRLADATARALRVQLIGMSKRD